MNKVEKIKAEIERLIKEINLFTPNEDGKNDTYECGRLAMASDILGIIDSLEEEPVSNDLEEASHNFVMNNYGNPKEPLYKFDQRCFIAGAQWQKEQMIDKTCEWLADNYSKYIITNGLSTIFSATIDFDTIRMIEDFKKAMEE